MALTYWGKEALKPWDWFWRRTQCSNKSMMPLLVGKISNKPIICSFCANQTCFSKNMIPCEDQAVRFQVLVQKEPRARVVGVSLEKIRWSSCRIESIEYWSWNQVIQDCRIDQNRSEWIRVMQPWHGQMLPQTIPICVQPIPVDPVRHLSAAREDPPRTNSCSHAIASQSPASDHEDLPR